MEGSLRTYKTEVRDKVCQRIREISKDIASAMECTAEVEFNWRDDGYPPVVNHAAQTQHIKRLATQWFGAQHLSEEDLPLTASEDFAYFVQERPGCFFCLGIKKPGSKPRTLHTSDYDFNDDMVATGGYFWVRLVEDRLQVSILKDKDK